MSDIYESFAEHGEKRDKESPMVRLFYEVIMDGYEAGASDIHMEPVETGMQIRMRVDGVLKIYRVLEKSVYVPLLTCAKIRSGMNIAERRLPQDGHYRAFLSGMEFNLRASTMPTVYGEKMVFRYLNRNEEIDHANTYGMDKVHHQRMSELLKRSGGIIYFTGPTGSGKSTTMYKILEQMAGESRNIMTIEDPVEKVIPGISQSQVNRQAGLTFETGLRAILRQDPDAIMIGETRDNQTAKTSVRAAITGNLVLSTLHTKDAVGVITRMTDLGVEPFMVAESLSGVVSQRLARKVCPCCRNSVSDGRGCDFCDHTGYKGRIAVHEILVIDNTIRRMIMERKTPEEILLYARRAQNMILLRESLMGLVEQGITTMEEYHRLVDF